MEQQKKAFEAQIKSIKVSTADEIENLTSLFSKASRELIMLTIEHRQTVEDFKNHKANAETVEAELKAQVEKEQAEVAQLKDDFEKFDQRLSAKTNEAEKLKRTLRSLNKDFKAL